ncbi:biotin-dependent carboxyltransferase family protein [Mycolicibacterium sp.]|uniref:5-oxoprolinase subunit C family protein n=1 Tax=Mycolicibacterium sp. TaxID=2320850 RepID=UPI003D0BA5E4
MSPNSVRIDSAGSSKITDLGRSYGPNIGLAVHGALDQFAARVANALVGNDEMAPLLELTVHDMAFTPDVDILVAVTGARTDVRVNGVKVPGWQPFLAPRGEQVTLTGIRDGARSYVAVRGGFEAARLMGSCAPEPALGIGGSLSDGDVVEVKGGRLDIENPVLGLVFFNFDVDRSMTEERFDIPIVWGPDCEDFDLIDTLVTETYEVGSRSNHIGMRMTGPSPRRRVTTEVLSRAVPVGAVEIPSPDSLLVLLRSRSVTAGYPVIAVATALGQDRLGQLRPGDRIRFVAQDLAVAVAEERRRRELAHRIAARSRGALGALRPDHALTRTTH